MFGVPSTSKAVITDPTWGSCTQCGDGYCDVVGGENLEKIKVEYALSDGLYCSGKGNFEINEELVRNVTKRMNTLVEQKTPITKSAYTLDEAIALFKKYNMKDKENVLYSTISQNRYLYFKRLRVSSLSH